LNTELPAAKGAKITRRTRKKSEENEDKIFRNTPMTQPISLLICALGGEGGGVLTEWIIATAHHAGYAAQSTSIPGVAQRTGATTYYVEVFPTPISQLGGKRPVFSLNPVPGALDALVSSELLETTRQIGNGMATNERTRVITSSARTFTTMERMQLADGRIDSAQLLGVVQVHSRAHNVFDMGQVAREAGTIVSAVMLGAVAGSGLFPFKRSDYEAVVSEGGGTSAASLRGFAKAFELVSAVPAAGSTVATSATTPSATPVDTTQATAMAKSALGDTTYVSKAQLAMVAQALPKDELLPQYPKGLQPDLASHFPAPVHEMLALGHARMLEYQGAAYAQLYIDRLKQVLQAEQAADTSATNNFATTREMARWLALWMAFDDIVRVADLKSRASRWQRVVGEVKANDDDLLKVFDHFKPGVPEFAALLPAALAHKLTAWDRRRILKGKTPWALPLKVGTHSIIGMLSLRTLASLTWLRVRGSRYATEQSMIEQWLQGVVQGTQRHWQLGHEIALCGRLIKGYGSTNDRGKDNLLHVLQHLAQGEDAHQAASAVQAARTAALADDAGKALDSALVQHGAPARPVKEQPIRFVRNPTQRKSTAVSPSK
jgi:indolepyruvate ferredoxin oxidoreductase, beta subunit